MLNVLYISFSMIIFHSKAMYSTYLNSHKEASDCSMLQLIDFFLESSVPMVFLFMRGCVQPCDGISCCRHFWRQGVNNSRR